MNIITDVLHQVKGGKEATVYCCAAHPSTGVDLIAAKVYRPREFRQLRNDAQYRQGRRILSDEPVFYLNASGTGASTMTPVTCLIDWRPGD
mgnify:CR=1 FL=1